VQLYLHEFLDRVKTRLVRHGWIKGSFGGSLTPSGSMCLVQAIREEAWEVHGRQWLTQDDVEHWVLVYLEQRHIRAPYPQASVVSFNDMSSTRWEHVEALLDEASRQAKEDDVKIDLTE
jgi:hypothetical protein